MLDRKNCMPYTATSFKCGKLMASGDVSHDHIQYISLYIILFLSYILSSCYPSAVWSSAEERQNLLQHLTGFLSFWNRFQIARQRGFCNSGSHEKVFEIVALPSLCLKFFTSSLFPYSQLRSSQRSVLFYVRPVVFRLHSGKMWSVSKAGFMSRDAGFASAFPQWWGLADGLAKNRGNQRSIFVLFPVHLLLFFIL